LKSESGGAEVQNGKRRWGDVLKKSNAIVSFKLKRKGSPKSCWKSAGEQREGGTGELTR